MLRKASSFWVLFALALLSSLVTASWGRANESATEFNIPPQALDSALLVFAEQGDVQVSVATVSIAGLRTQGAVGRFTPSVALARLLSDTGLQFTTVGDRTYSVSLAGSGSNRTGMLRMPTDSATTLPQIAALRNSASSASAQAESATQLPPTAQPDHATKPLLDEIVVTGSHIRGVDPVGSQTIVLDQEFIDRSGYATVQDVLKVLPQNSGGGISEDNTTDPTALNLNSGTAVNLRGLGADSTLVLVNGVRQPAGGLNGAFVDVSNIAASAIERIEVLTDGASAIYGSDAIGGVVNIILQRDYDGAETRVRAGSFDGDSDENQLSQLLGTSWSTGSTMLAYQFYERDALSRSDRPYTASDDLRPFGGTDHRGFFSNPGNILNLGAPAFAIPEGQDGTALTPADLIPGGVNLNESAEQTDLLAEQRMHGAYLTATQSIGVGLELSGSARYSLRDSDKRLGGVQRTVRVRSTNPYFVTPMAGATSVTIAYNFLDDLGPLTVQAESETFGGDVGVSSRLGDDWRLSITGSYGEERNNSYSLNNVNNAALTLALADTNPATAFNPFGDGSNTNRETIERIRGGNANRANSQMETIFAIADGSVFAAPGGPAKLAIGADYRDESLVKVNSVNGTRTLLVGLSRQVSAGFAEMVVPFVGGENQHRGLHRLELSLAGRYEDYSDFGSSFNPRVGLNWSPSSSLSLRTSWGTSFRAPRLVELLEARPQNSESLQILPDPQSATGSSTVLFRTGHNSQLQEETARTWSVGADFNPEEVEGIDLSVNYYEIDYEDRIAAGGPPGDPFTVLLQESQWREIVDRTPERAEIVALCNSPFFVGDVATCLVTEPAAIVDVRLRNLSSVNVSGVDAMFDLSLATGAGDLHASLNGNYVLEFERAVSKFSGATDIVDTVGNAPDWRLRASLGWFFRGLGIDAVVNHTDGYKDDIRTPSRSIESWTTVDLGFSYRSDSQNGWMEGFELGLSAVNVLDEEPPFVDIANFGYDSANADLYGRVLSVRFAKSW